MSFGGPIFERAINGPWESVHHKDGGHYNTFACRSDATGMGALREFFDTGEANEFNQCLFSTSGVHGSYSTIEEVEAYVAVKASGAEIDEDDEGPSHVTFVIVQPRLATIRYGNCTPITPEDFVFLKKLRQSSWDALVKIGRPEEDAGE